MSNATEIPWAKIKPGKPLFVPANNGRIQAIRNRATAWNTLTKLRFSVRKEVRDTVAGVRIERR
jgi:hypothetical protein